MRPVEVGASAVQVEPHPRTSTTGHRAPGPNHQTLHFPPTDVHGHGVIATNGHGTIAEEVIAHLAGLVGADVTVSLDIAADVPEGVPENVVRTVSENSRTLKFQSHGFEES